MRKQPYPENPEITADNLLEYMLLDITEQTGGVIEFGCGGPRADNCWYCIRIGASGHRIIDAAISPEQGIIHIWAPESFKEGAPKGSDKLRLITNIQNPKSYELIKEVIINSKNLLLASFKLRDNSRPNIV